MIEKIPPSAPAKQPLHETEKSHFPHAPRRRRPPNRISNPMPGLDPQQTPGIDRSPFPPRE